MKYYITPMLLLLALLSKAFGQAQPQLPNGGFENWGTRSSSFYEEPISWFTLNSLKQFGYPASCTKSLDAHSGNYAVELTTKAGPFSDIPGILTSGDMVGANNQPDFDHNFIAFSGRPYSMNFWFKSIPVTGDSVLCYILLTKWNMLTSKRDTIAKAYWQSTQTIQQYTEAINLFYYYSNQNPDSASVIFASSMDPYTPMVGSKLLIDDFSFSYNWPASTHRISARTSISFFPNPANESITILHALNKADLHIFDLTGKELLAITSVPSNEAIPMSQLERGSYLILLSDEHQNTVYRATLIITN